MAFNIWEDIMIECNGKIVTGTYSVSDWMITVKIEGGREIRSTWKYAAKNFGRVGYCASWQERQTGCQVKTNDAGK
jgi:hypothetical protein